MKNSQNERIKGALKKGRKLTALDALNDFGCFRLASRISDLRKEGLPIIKKMITENGKTFAQYSLQKGTK